MPIATFTTLYMKALSIALLCLFGATAVAQMPGFLHFTVQDGLPSNVIYCGLQDTEGYHWLGTDRGLVRFDGARFKTYGIADGLPDPEVFVLYEDSQQRLWASTFSPYLAYRRGGCFQHRENDSLVASLPPTSTVSHFFEDGASALWVSGDSLLQVSPTGELRGYDIGPKFRVYQVGTDHIGFQNKSLYQFNPTTGHARELRHLGSGGRLLFVAVSGRRILCAYQNATYLLEYQPGQARLLDSLSMGITHVMTDRRGRFWGSVPGRGAVCFDNPERNLNHPRWYLPGRKINTIYQDKQGNMWFLTAGEGAYMLPDREMSHWRAGLGLPSSSVLSLAYDAVTGQVLAGDDLGHVHRLAGGALLQSHALGPDLTKNFVRQILPTSKGGFWAVTDLGFFTVHTGSTIGEHDTSPISVGLGAPKWMLPSPAGYWMATHQSVFHWPAKEGKVLPQQEGRVTAIALDTSGMLWKGSTNGLYSQEDGFKYNWAERFPALKSRVIALQPSPDGGLWVVNTRHGLLRATIVQGKIQAISIVNYSPETPFTGIKNLRAMPNGSVWLATNQGAIRLDSSGQYARFTTHHGLASNDVNDVLPVGDTLWAATADGLSMLVLKPEGASTDVQAVLTAFRYQHQGKSQTLDFSGKGQGPAYIALPPGAQLPEAHFAGLCASPGQVLRYAHVYRQALLPFPYYTFSNLWGGFSGTLDTLWTEGATFNLGAALPPGSYRYHTAALVLEHGPSAPAEWHIVALPQFMQTVWPWLILLTAVGLLVWRFHWLRTRFFQMESAVAQLKLQALRAQINPHFVGNSINAIQKFFYPPDPEKASDYIHLFTVLLRKTLRLSEEDFIPFSEELQYNREYLEMIKLRYAGQFTYHISGTENIPPDIRFPTMFLQPILENATLHGLSPKGSSVLHLDFQWSGNRVQCTITDNGVGIRRAQAIRKERPSKHVSKGIKLLENKAHMLNTLYGIQLRLQYRDRSAEAKVQGISGTEVHVSFCPPSLKPTSS